MLGVTGSGVGVAGSGVGVAASGVGVAASGAGRGWVRCGCVRVWGREFVLGVGKCW